LACWELEVQSCGIPHLAKNERDVGHPRAVVRTKLGVEEFSEVVVAGADAFDGRTVDVVLLNEVVLDL
jgi:hypothetical protein